MPADSHAPAAPATPSTAARPTASVCIIVGSVTTCVMLVADIFYWSGATPAQLGYQEHGALIGLCAVLFIVGGLAWLLDGLARWLDQRAEERHAALMERLAELGVQREINGVVRRIRDPRGIG